MPGPRIVHAVTSPLTVTLMRGQLAHLRHAGFEVAVISAPGEQLDRICGEQDVLPVPVPMEREIAPLRDLAAWWRIYRILRRLRPDLVNSGTPKAGLLVGVAAWLAGVPCRLHTLRGLRSDTAGGLKRRVLLLAERISCRAAHRVLCNSESLRRRAIALGLTDAQHSLVLGHGSSNGVEVSLFVSSPELLRQAAELRKYLEIPSGAPVIGFVGRLTRDKGILELVQAFDILRARRPELRLLLVGDREQGDPLPAGVQERLERDPQIVCTGWVADPAPYYPLMSVYCLPTHREGFPNSVLEAHASGLAVVTTTATGAVDAVEDGVTGLLVPPANAAVLAQALERLLADRPWAARMGAAGRERVARGFQPVAIWEALVALYRDLLREQGVATAETAVPSR
jgi:glycosyltransferase involved in cell wall biosynthesis